MFSDNVLHVQCQNFWYVYQAVLKPSVFSTMLRRKQLEEVKAAGIEDLETCPFCDFASIPPIEDKVFHCLNPDCMRESCRYVAWLFNVSQFKVFSHLMFQFHEFQVNNFSVKSLIYDFLSSLLRASAPKRNVRNSSLYFWIYLHHHCFKNYIMHMFCTGFISFLLRLMLTIQNYKCSWILFSLNSVVSCFLTAPLTCRNNLDTSII
jgi:hypothetical protein